METELLGQPASMSGQMTGKLPKREELNKIFRLNDQVVDLVVEKMGIAPLEAVQMSIEVARPGNAAPEQQMQWVAAVVACDDRYDVSWELAHEYLEWCDIVLEVTTPPEGYDLAHGKLPERWFSLIPPEAFEHYAARRQPGDNSPRLRATTEDPSGTSQNFVSDMIADADETRKVDEIDAHLEELARRKESGEPVSYGAVTDSLKWRTAKDDDGDDIDGEPDTEPLQYDADLVNACAYHAKVLIPDVVECLDIRMAAKLDQAEVARTLPVWQWYVAAVIYGAVDETTGMPFANFESIQSTHEFILATSLGREGSQVRRHLVNGRMPALWKGRIAPAWKTWRESQTETTTPADTRTAETPSQDHTPSPAVSGAVDAEPTSVSTVAPASTEEPDGEVDWVEQVQWCSEDPKAAAHEINDLKSDVANLRARLAERSGADNSLTELFAWLDNEGLTPDDLDLRRTCLTSSGFSTTVGHNPHEKSIELYRNKVDGYSKPMSDAMRMGLILEPVVLFMYQQWLLEHDDRYTDVSQLEYAPGTMEHGELDWVAASPDVILHLGSTCRNVQIKTTSEYWTELPLHIIDQVHIEWDVIRSRSDVPVEHVVHVPTLSACHGFQFKVWKVEIDEEYLAKLLEHGGAWWRKYVVAKVPPPIDASDPDQVKLRYPRDEVAELAVADGFCEKVLEKYVRLYQFRKKAELGEEKLKALLTSRIGDHSGLEFANGHKMTWKADRNGTRRFLPNIKKLVEEP